MNQEERLSILFVDADRRVLNGLCAMFRREYRVFTAAAVHEALQALNEHAIDVVVSDDRLPDTTGLDLLHWVRLRSPHAARILLVNAGDPQYDAATVKRARVSRLLVKPCAPDVLRTTIEQAARSARVALAQELREGTSGRRGPAGASRSGRAAGGTGPAAKSPSCGPLGATGPGANDAPPVSTTSAGSGDDSGLHQSLTGTYRTFVGHGPAPAVEPDAAAAALRGAPGAGATADGDGDGDGRSANCRTWSVGGITVEEDADADPADTARLFADMLQASEARRRADAGRVPPGSLVAPGATAAARRTSPREPATGPTPEPGEITLAGGGRVPVDLIVLTPDAVAAAQVHRTVAGSHRLHYAATPVEALDQLCSAACNVMIVDGRGRPRCAVTRTVRLCRQVAPELHSIVLVTRDEAAGYDVLDPTLGIVTLMFAPIEADHLHGAVGWAARLAEAAGERGPDDVAAAGAGDEDAGGFTGRLRRVSRLWSRQ